MIRTRTILPLLLIIIFLFSSTTLLQSKTFKFLFDLKDNNQEINLINQSNEIINLNRKFAEFIFEGTPAVISFENFPVANNTFMGITLLIDKSSLAPKTKFMVIDENGLHPYQPKVILTYTGYLNNDKNSKVYLTYSDGNIFALIRHSSGEIYSISPEKRINGISQKHIISRGDNFTNKEIPWLCLTENATENHTFTEDIKHINDIPLSPSKLIDVEVACEGTYEFFRLFYNIDQATDYIASVMTFASKLYEENINVRLTISYILIWQVADVDPYKDAPYLNDKLSLMPKYWKERDVDRSIAVLFASLQAQPGGTYVAGIAFGGIPGKGNLCNKNWGYCVLGIKGGVQFPTTNYSWDVNVAAHEIGHLFGAPHTHRCYWDPPIDTCVTKDMGISDACLSSGVVPRPGTIMSYCHLTNSSHSVQLYFHDLQKSLMRKAAESATCNKEVDTPYISLLNPLGGNIYKAGDLIPIRWTASHVNKISLKYSVDGGKNWAKIADYLNVNDSVYFWSAPDITADKVMILIHKSTDMAIHDMSWINFSIMQPSITFIEPEANEEFPQGSNIKIQWQSVFVDSLKISFSSDNGSNWIEIARLQKTNEYSWKLPMIESDFCRFRITSLDETNIMSLSENFAVGKPKVVIFSPSDNDILCIRERKDVNWQSKYVQSVYLKYSVDDGENWKKVTPIPFKSGNQTYSWKIPDRPSDKVKLQISTKIDGNYKTLAQTNGRMIIRECTSDLNIDEENPESITVFPIPANDIIYIKLAPNYLTSRYKIDLYNIKGKLLKEFINSSNETSLKYDLSEFSPGNYYFRIEIGNKVFTKMFNIVR